MQQQAGLWTTCFCLGQRDDGIVNQMPVRLAIEAAATGACILGRLTIANLSLLLCVFPFQCSQRPAVYYILFTIATHSFCLCCCCLHLQHIRCPALPCPAISLQPWQLILDVAASDNPAYDPVITTSPLKHLPAGTCQLPHLQQLSLRGCNALTDLPDALGALSSLTLLEMEGCHGLKVLPDSIEQLQALRCLHINGANSLEVGGVMFETASEFECMQRKEEETKWLRRCVVQSRGS